HSQIDLGGDEDQFRAKARIEWNKGDRNVLQELTRTLNHIKAPEARVIAVRELSSELIARKKKELAFNVASSQSAEGAKGAASPVLPQLIALRLAYGGEMKGSPVLIKPPDPKLPLELPTRLAYSEGHARKGDYEEAMNLLVPPPKPDQRQACIGVACVLLT